MKHLILPDPHSHHLFSNERADWIGQLILDESPDVVINLGDHFDMPSLSSFDKGKRAYVGQTYKADINAGLDFHQRMWAPVKKRKKKMPRRVVLEGNHEHRLEKALDLTPHLEGTISFRDYDFDTYYDDVVMYDGNTPGMITIDGVQYAHFFPGGLLGRPPSGEHMAYSLLSKRYTSSTMGHSHIMDYAYRRTADGRNVHGLVAGCYIDYRSTWAGLSQNLWRPCVIVKNNVENGNYDLKVISMESLKKCYGQG